MSRTSLGQKNQLRQREQASSLRQVQSVRKNNYQQQYFQTHIRISEEVEYFLHMKERYLKAQKENRFFDLNSDPAIYNSIKDGYGVSTFKNGDRYIGFWEKNLMEGMGIYTSKGTQGVIAYLGEFYMGKFHGIGKLVRMLDDQNGEIIYRGTWVEGKKSEQGVYFYENPQVYYQGGWLNDEKSGEGKLMFINGEYVGSWLNNVRHGQGRLRKTEKGLTLVYQGVWDSDQLPEGQITYIDSTGNELSRYKGHLYKGKKHGHGIYSWKNGIFQGSFEEDRIKGDGILKTSQVSLTGFFYSNNEVMQDAQNLNAVIHYENKDSYDGSVNINQGNIVREKGKYFFSNGDTAEGRFNDNMEGKLSGSFSYRWKNGDQTNF